MIIMRKIFLIIILTLCFLAFLFDFYEPMRKYALPLNYPFNNPAWLIELIGAIIVVGIAFKINPKFAFAIILTLLIIALLELSQVRAWNYVTTLNDSSSAKNLTFTTSENKTVWIRLPKNVRVIDAKLNLTGFPSYDDLKTQIGDVNYTENSKFLINFTKNEFNATQNKETGEWFLGNDGFQFLFTTGGNDNYWKTMTVLESKDGFYKKINLTDSEGKIWETITFYANYSVMHVHFYSDIGTYTVQKDFPGVGGVVKSSDVYYFWSNSSGIQSGTTDGITCQDPISGSPSVKFIGWNKTIAGFNVSENSLIIKNFVNNTPFNNSYNPGIVCYDSGYGAGKVWFKLIS